MSKIDKYDKGISEKLQGMGSGSLSLPLGCVAVLNRTQDEIDANIPFAEMREREKRFFAAHSAFNGVPEDFLGSRSLIKKLVTIQQKTIRSHLPVFIEKVRAKLKERKKELDRIPKCIQSEAEASAVFYEILRNFRNAIEQRMRGDYEIKFDENSSFWNPTQQDQWDDRIAYHLKMGIRHTSKEIDDIFSKISTTEHQTKMRQAVQNNYGGGLPNFPSTNIIQQLYQPLYNQLEKPCRSFVIFVKNYTRNCLKYILDRVIPPEASFKDTLIRELGRVIEYVTSDCEDKFMKSIDQILIMEEKVFTLNPYYMEVFNKAVKAAEDVSAGLKSTTGAASTQKRGFFCLIFEVILLIDSNSPSFRYDWSSKVRD